MSRINNKNVKIGENYLLPLENSSLSKYEARAESIMSSVEMERNKLIEKARIEAESFSQKTMTDAESQAEVIINGAKNESLKIIQDAEAKQAQITAQTDEISKKAYDEGFQKGIDDGYAKFKEDAKSALISLDSLADTSFDLKKNIIKSADLDIVDLVVAITRKVTEKSFDEQMLKELTTAAIKQLKNKEHITIIVNPQLVDNISNLVEGFKEEISQLQSIKIIEDSSLSCDGTIVESPLSRVDCRLSAQIDEIAAKLINGVTDDVQQE